jgi:hypothetical protein
MTGMDNVLDMLLGNLNEVPAARNAHPCWPVRVIEHLNPEWVTFLSEQEYLVRIFPVREETHGNVFRLLALNPDRHKRLHGSVVSYALVAVYSADQGFL